MGDQAFPQLAWYDPLTSDSNPSGTKGAEDIGT